MDIVWEGILMILLIAIILIFIILSLLNFFQPKSSIYYYDNFASMAQSACTSSQLSSNQQFNSPNALIFQIYDDAACNSALTSSKSIFNSSAPYDSSAMENSYLLCYAAPGSSMPLSTGTQYYFASTATSSTTYSLEVNAASSQQTGQTFAYLSAFSYQNVLDVPDIQVNSTPTSASFLTLATNASGKSITFSSSPSYTFDITLYTNISSDFYISFGSCTKGPYNSPAGQVSFYNISDPCTSSFSAIGAEIQPTSTNAVPMTYQINITASENVNGSAGAHTGQGELALQCLNLPNSVKTGFIANQSITCKPIKCGAVSFALTDTSNRAFLGLYGGTYSTLGVQTGEGDLQIINPNTEIVQNTSLIP